MLNKITLQGFKGFYKEQGVSLSPITIMYGKNGRGKSTVAQTLLLLAQTMQHNNDINELQVDGKFISLGNFSDLLNSHSTTGSFHITLESPTENVEMGFSEHAEKRQTGFLSKLRVNGEDRFDIKTTDNDADNDEHSHAQATTSSDIITLQNLKSLRYVSAERVGPRNTSMRKDTLDNDWIGVDGQYVINVLAMQGKDFQESVCEHLSEIMSGAALKINNDDPDRIELLLNSNDGEEVFHPTNVGFGYSFVLPVIVSALLAEENSILVIENPEAHLHPGAQSRLMKFLINLSVEKKYQIIIETHSDHVVNGLRIAMKEGMLTSDDGHINYFSTEKKDIQVTKITCDKKGTLSEYPDDFMDEWTLQMIRLV